MSGDLAAWLLEQIAEDERVAQKSLRQKWDQPTDAPWRRSRLIVETGVATAADTLMARFGDPIRVLAECAAKRAIVRIHHLWEDGGTNGDSCHSDGDPWPCPTLRALAQPYADRSGWRAEWSQP